jgi:GT2 family glycosyltransferase
MSKPGFQIKSITAIVVTFNSSNFIDACLSALKTSSEEDLEVIVVDNCSDDTTVDLVKRLHPNVKLIQNDKNLGFCWDWFNG